MIRVPAQGPFLEAAIPAHLKLQGRTFVSQGTQLDTSTAPSRSVQYHAVFRLFEYEWAPAGLCVLRFHDRTIECHDSVKGLFILTVAGRECSAWCVTGWSPNALCRE